MTEPGAPTPLTVNEAIDIFARRILADAAIIADWEDFPWIGENDWEAIAKRVIELAPWPERHREAYELLERRASE